MSNHVILNRVLGAAAGCAMLAATWAPASAMTLSGASPAEHFASTQIEKVWWCRWGCGGYGWRRGWGPGWGGPGWGYRAGWGPGWGYRGGWGWHGGYGWRRW